VKIAIINNLNFGSTGNLSLTLKQFLTKKGFDVRFFHAFGKKKDGMYRFSNNLNLKINRILSLLGANRYEGLKHPTRILLRMLDEYKPDLINIQCLNIGSVNLRLLFNYIKKRNIPVIATCHAFFYSTGNCGHPINGCTKYLDGCVGCEYRIIASKSLFRKTSTNFIQMKEWFTGANIHFTAVSDYVANVTKTSPLTKDFDSDTTLNSIDTSIFHFRGREHNEGDKKVRVLFTSSDIKGKLKGFNYFLDLLERFKDEEDFIFYFVGKAKITTNNPNFVNLGFKHSREEMAKAYQGSDLTIMLSKEETFGMPIAESLCCGTPVAFFKCGGTESMTIKEFSEEIEHGDLEALAQYIISKKYLFINKSKIAQKAQRKFDVDIVNENYLKLINKMVKR
jgi:glycosyltransferase involved in cell wall biosynthesis